MGNKIIFIIEQINITEYNHKKKSETYLTFYQSVTIIFQQIQISFDH